MAYDWRREHDAGMQEPRGWEVSIWYFMRGLRENNPEFLRKGCASYRRMYQRRFESEVDEDYILGDEGILVIEQDFSNRAAVIRAVRTLLNGEHGRLDAGTLDAELVALGNGG